MSTTDSSPQDESGSRPPLCGPRFFLACPHRPQSPRLLAEEEHHARNVLRLSKGDACVGLDGRGGSWPLRVTSMTRAGISLESDGPGQHEPAPGEPGSVLPWIEVAVAWPPGGRSDPLLEALTQLGVAAVTPLVCLRRGARGAPEPGSGRAQRSERVLRTACKQSGRSWLPLLGPALSPAELVAQRPKAPGVCLDPEAPMALNTWVRAWAAEAPTPTRPERPLLLAIGPEGGFDPEERSALSAAGLGSARIAPHTLRIETAAVAALAVTVAGYS